MRTSIFSTTGRPPGTIAVTAIGTVPGEPARTQPNESTAPWNRPPCALNRTIAPGMTLPRASSACTRQLQRVADGDGADRRRDAQPRRGDSSAPALEGPCPTEAC